MASKPKRIVNGCKNCGRDAYQIWHHDNHGMSELLETHCNKCKWNEDSEGKVRYQGNPVEGTFAVALLFEQQESFASSFEGQRSSLEKR